MEPHNKPIEKEGSKVGFAQRNGSLARRDGSFMMKNKQLGKSVRDLNAEIQKSITHRLENSHQYWNANNNFLELYEPYIKSEWRFHYFAYDTMKAKYKVLKDQSKRDLVSFEKLFYNEIQHVDWFLSSNLREIELDLKTIHDSCDELNSDPKKKEEMERTMELFIRKIFEKCKNCEKYYKLNHYVICKIAKKFEKLIEKEVEKAREFTPWKEYPSSSLFHTFSNRVNEINFLTAQSITTYSEKFRQTYPSLAYGELEFVKNKERENSRTRFYIGVKIGIAISAIVWLISDSYTNTRESTLQFWEQPGLYVYTTVGNLMLFRICWACNIYIWSLYDVNYISLMNLSDVKPNLLLVVNQTASQFILYLANLIVFIHVNTNSATNRQPVPRFLSYACPSLLILVFLLYEAYMYFRFRGESLSRGLFTKEVFYDCVAAPFAKVTFRDNYAADTLTSFTKVISDLLNASCWVISGSFLHPHQTISDFGSAYMSCNGDNMALAICIFQLYPQYIRIAQCLRNYYKTGLNLHLFNIAKYLTTVAVIIYGQFHKTIDITYITLAVVSAFYKWFWDVYMDWGMFEVMPTWKGGWQQFCCCRSFEYVNSLPGSRHGRAGNYSSVTSSTITTPGSKSDLYREEDDSGKNSFRGAMFLRESMLYPSYTAYYIAIVLDLVLRCTWVFSLLPLVAFGSFVGPKLSFFLASLEIIRRSMWGVFRLEYEHLKFVKKGTPGYLEMRHKGNRRNAVGVDYEHEEEQLRDYTLRLKPVPTLSAVKESPAEVMITPESDEKGEETSTPRLRSISNAVNKALNRQSSGNMKSPNRYASPSTIPRMNGSKDNLRLENPSSSSGSEDSADRVPGSAGGSNGGGSRSWKGKNLLEEMEKGSVKSLVGGTGYNGIRSNVSSENNQIINIEEDEL